MTRLHYFLVGLLMSLTLAAVSPSMPPTRIIAGSGVTVVTNGVNNFTLSASGGTTNTLIATTGAFIITNSPGVWTIGGTNSLAAGSGITITTNAANSWTVASAGGVVRTLVVDTTSTTNNGGSWLTLQTNQLAANQLAALGDSLRFTYAGQWQADMSGNGVRFKLGATTLLEASPGAWDTMTPAQWVLRGSITRHSVTNQRVELTFIQDTTSTLGSLGTKVTVLTSEETLSDPLPLLLESQGGASKEVFRLLFEPAP